VSDIAAVVLVLGMLLAELEDVDDMEPVLAEPEPPQAARPRGRARVRAAIVLRRASRMVSLLGWDVLTPVLRRNPPIGLP
jgi:hypothetical protein